MVIPLRSVDSYSSAIERESHVVALNSQPSGEHSLDALLQ
jgi:hypothetical protein